MNESSWKDAKSFEQSPQKLTRQDVLEKIEVNGGPGSVDFVGCDLSAIDLSFEPVQAVIDEQIQPVWYSNNTHGINLRGARFVRANLTDARLVQADLSEATLNHANLKSSDCHDSKFIDSFLVDIKAQQANFVYCDMRGCYLIRAILHNADFSNARLQGADLSGAELNNAILCNAKLTEADFTNAKLEGVNLFGAWLAGTFLTRQQIGDRIIQEYEGYEHPNYVHRDQESGAIPGRYAQATSIYRALKNNFLSIGSYHDASWAYVKERKMRKQTHWPPKRLRESYPAEFSGLPQKGLKGKWCLLQFYGKNFVSFILDWVFELTSEYGEKPSLTLLWALAFVLSFTFLFQWIGGITGPQTWLDYFNYSLGSFVTVSFGEFEAVTPLAKTFTSLEALLGICVLGLLMFALGNRINRS
jgi:uncharacterized protein YjbI with pentapeptide repeats